MNLRLAPRKTLVFRAILFITLASTFAGSRARADRRPPFGTDAGLLEARVREEVERKIAPLIEQMAPGQAELGYVDVRVNRPTALATGTTPGFEDLGPGADFVAERIEVNLQMDSKLPAPFRKDLKSLITARLDPLAVPVDIKERVFPFPTPRPQPPQPREPLPYYPQPPSQPPQAQQPAPPPPTGNQPAALNKPPEAPPSAVTPAWPAWLGVLGIIAVLLLAATVGLLAALLVTRRRHDGRSVEAEGDGKAARAGGAPSSTKEAVLPAADHWPEVRRALTEDRVLARRVMSELLAESQHDKVARAVELVGPGVVEDLRTDPVYVDGLREAAQRLTSSAPLSGNELRALGDELHRRLLKHRMMGAEDPVAQAFAFLGSLPATRFAAVLRGEHPAAQATALRYAPPHLRSAFMTGATLEERATLAVALADGKGTSKDYLLDVAATLRARAVQQAHVGGADTDDLELLVEMLEEAPMDEQGKLMDTIGRAEPAKLERLRAALISEERLLRLGDDLLAAAALAVPRETLAIFLRRASQPVVARVLAVLPAAVVGSLREELSLEVPVSAEATVEARRTLHRAIRRAARERGWGTAGNDSAHVRKVVAV